jgi:protein gp37
MSDKTKIEWTDATWNPIRGCSRISEGCRNCYAEGVANRFKGVGMPYEGLIAKTGQWNGTIKFIDSVLDQPIRWKRPRRIFVNSMSDLFHENLPFSEIDTIFAVMSAANWHTYQVLTKRADRMQKYFKNDDWIDRVRKIAWDLNPASAYHETHMIGGLPNVWLGVSVEDQKTADDRIPYLLETPAAVRWISAEPLLGEIDLTRLSPTLFDASANALTGYWRWTDGPKKKESNALNWVVVGGESGGNARPMHPNWVRNLRNQCVNANVQFFFKQWGSWREPNQNEEFNTSNGMAQKKPAFIVGSDGTVNCFRSASIPDPAVMVLAGKKNSGRTLDGKEWNQYPS